MSWFWQFLFCFSQMALQTEQAPHVESHNKMFHLKLLTWLQIACKMDSYFKINCNLAHHSWTAQMSKTILLAGFASYTNLEISFWGSYSKFVSKKTNTKEHQTIFFSPKFSVFSALSQFGMKINVKDWNIRTLRRGGFFFLISSNMCVYQKASKQ